MVQDLTWHEICVLADLEDEGVYGVELGGLPIAVYDVDGEIFATHDICTHGLARLSEGFLDGDLIECPLHQGLFNVKTGAPAGAPCTEAVRTFPVKCEGEKIFVAITEDAA
ncbi:non-heme iron oxygenase ferredoxin subunit [Kordiimonas pumila]|uniref:Non-heme iron oxygenase ferredoxin subunit n=1 Tax=Kordiimonas pumila TaxID=2161677 RepID=A0ABV7D3Z7_9PROT|nr:non-heme iron oxygenase ferredoxin subunit [Kordiimonas pumila]